MSDNQLSERKVETEAKWYIVHTYNGYEAMVKDTFEKMIENNSLQNQIIDIKILMEQTIEEKGNKKKIVQKKVFPTYVFIKLVYSNDLWYLITNTRGVTGFVGPQGKACALSDEEVKRLHLEDAPVDVDYVVGDKVTIISGPFEGFTGDIEDVNVSTMKAKIKVELFNNLTEVVVDFSQIQKSN